MRVDGLTISIKAGAAVAAHRIVQYDGSGGAIQATGPTDPSFGVSDLGADSGAAAWTSRTLELSSNSVQGDRCQTQARHGRCAP